VLRHTTPTTKKKKRHVGERPKAQRVRGGSDDGEKRRMGRGEEFIANLNDLT